MIIFNYISIFILSMLIGKILWFSYNRNKHIEIIGKEDNLPIFSIILLSFFIIPLEIDIVPLSAIRNILFYFLLFSTYFIKRGVSKKGFEKFLITIKWENINYVLVERYLVDKVLIKVVSNDKTHSLIFNQSKLNKTLAYISQRVKDVKIDSRINMLL